MVNCIARYPLSVFNASKEDKLIPIAGIKFTLNRKETYFFDELQNPFWCLLGSQVIMWNGIPIYRRLLSSGTEGAGAKEFVMTAMAIIVRQPDVGMIRQRRNSLLREV